MITFAILIISLKANFEVISPVELRNKFNDVNFAIPFGVGNFGHVPYGRKIKGPLVIGEPLDACTDSELAANLTKSIWLVKRG